MGFPHVPGDCDLPMKRPQITLRSLLVAMLFVAAFFAGIRFERERRRREDGIKTIIAALDEKTEFHFAEQSLSEVIDYLA